MTMRDTYQGIGWFARKTPDPHPTIDFYRDIVGLPALRGRDHSQMFWVGETTVLWVTLGGSRPPVYTDRAQAPLIPVFRCHGIQRTIDRLKTAGATFINDFHPEPSSRLAYFLDPSGNVTGLQERSRESPRPADQEAWRRWDAGETRVEGIPPLPPDIQSLGWVVLRVSDLERSKAFYRDVVGFPLVSEREGGAMFDLGETVLMDIQPGGTPQPPVADRKDANNCVMMRVHGLDALARDLAAKGVHFVNPPFDGSGRLAYFTDPDGILWGLQERLPDSPRPEDREAARRWARQSR
jgi:predicted enzyme related to lactoylglutathione lyase